ncbi:hypothetical protein KIN20_030976 [Parelaphostrongylus tenuis]|uniref:Uncharacterized protein n=1 Tax=Parelaphostrongylus tenuis TaxID=148309 RepID=A0AAD5WGW4_PARTN|nr:hypothetical protein KIN20_030976 [Parelaphostrongylus tenuis]
MTTYTAEVFVKRIKELYSQLPIFFFDHGMTIAAAAMFKLETPSKTLSSDGHEEWCISLKNDSWSSSYPHFWPRSSSLTNSEFSQESTSS